MLADIYKFGPLKYPEVFRCDNGSEFKADVTKLLEKIRLKLSEPPPSISTPTPLLLNL